MKTQSALIRFTVLLAGLLFLSGCGKKTEFPVSLSYQDTGSGAGLPYYDTHRIDLVAPDSLESPVRLPEDIGRRPLATQFSLGNTGEIITLVFAKSGDKNLYYDLLYIDRNRDGDLTNDGPPKKGSSSFIRGRARHMTEFDDVEFTYLWQTKIDERVTEKMVCKLFFWYPENGLPASSFIIRKSWRIGTFAYQDDSLLVVLVDDDCNGIYDTRDRWLLMPKDSLSGRFIGHFDEYRETTRLGWFGDTAFELKEIAARGDRVVLRVKEAGITSEEDRLQDAIYPPEPRRPRAARQIKWMTDWRQAQRKARQLRKNMLAFFDAEWSGPAITMNQRTFTDAEILSLTDNFICVRILDTSNRELINKYQIQDFPTLIIFDRRGKELSRVVGYQPAAELAQYLKSRINK